MAMPGARVRLLLATALALVVLAAVAYLLWPRTQPLPDEPTAQLLAAAQGLDDVAVDAVFDPAKRTVQVTQRMTLTNRTGKAQELLVLRAYANAFASEDTSPAATEELYDACYPDGFSEGYLTISAMRVAMQGLGVTDQAYAYTDDAGTVMELALPMVWGAGEALTLEAVYTVYIPEVAHRFGASDGVYSLGNAFLIPAPYVAGAYVTDAYYSIGEPFSSECRNYEVRLTLPQGYAVAGSAAPVSQKLEGGLETVRLYAPAVRDFALCISHEWKQAHMRHNGVLVMAYAKSTAHARSLLTYAAAALACYEARYGAYPYPAYTLCETTIPFDSMAYPALGMVSKSVVDVGGDALEQLVAREVAHQWWGTLIGTDQYNQPWQDEALCEFSLLEYWEMRKGKAARDALAYERLETAMRVTIPRGVTPGSPIDYFGDWSEYRVVVHGRGGAAMIALNLALEGGLNDFLALYYERYAFASATRADFETLLAGVTGEDWTPLLSDYLDTNLNN